MCPFRYYVIYSVELIYITRKDSGYMRLLDQYFQ